MNITESFELKGKWFLPSAPEQVAYGTVKYDVVKGITLELLGTYSGSFHDRLNVDQPIICGITSDSKCITLYKCFLSTQGGLHLIQGGPVGEPLIIYRAFYIIEGHLFEKPEDILFEKAEVELYNLAEWVGVHGFEYDKAAYTVENNLSARVQYKLPETIPFRISESLLGSFEFVGHHPGWSRFVGEQTVSQKTVLTISSSTELKFEDFLDEIFKFQNFLTLALYHTTHLTRLTFSNTRYKHDYGEDFGKNRYKLEPINIFFPSASEKKLTEPKLDIEMLFDYNRTKSNFQSIIESWYKLYARLRPVFDLLFEQFHNGHRFSENSFLNLAQATESFHARFHESITRMPKKDYKEMRTELLAIAPAKFKEWLENVLQYGNAPTLQQRLDFMVNKYWNSLLEELISDREEFAKDVRKARNYYTHYSASEEKKALNVSQLYPLALKLKVLLCIAIMREIGLSHELVENSLQAIKPRYFRFFSNKKEEAI